MSDPDFEHVVIVGAGLAGDRCAFALRAGGYIGALTLVGAEAHRPYDRPPLSKAVLKTHGEEDKIFYRPFEDYAEARIDLRLGVAVAAIDPVNRRVTFIDGEALAYDRLILATGSQLRELPDLPRHAQGVFYLRDRDDALALRAAFAAGGSAAVIGGGVIGLEAAAAAADRGLPVVVIEPEPRVMARACGEIVGGLLAGRHRAAGVDIQCGVGLRSAHREDATWHLDLTDGRVVTADIVIVGVGVIPASELAEAAGLDVGRGGIVVDGRGRTSDPFIYATGEVTYHYNSRIGAHDRQENWHHAAAHGEHVGRAIAGAAEDYAELSGFWTDQYELSIQSVGCALAERDILRGDPASGRFTLFHLDGPTLVGASGAKCASELRQAKVLIRSGARVDPERLANPEIKVSAAAL